jgi:hypothetical protein
MIHRDGKLKKDGKELLIDKERHIDLHNIK